MKISLRDPLYRFAFALATALAGPCVAAGSAEWRELEFGMEVGRLEVPRSDSDGTAEITLVRLDATRWPLVFLGLSNTKEAQGLTAREWAVRHRLAVAINAGMFHQDYRTHTGFLRAGDHFNSSKVNGYQSVLAFDPKVAGAAPAIRIFDLDDAGVSIDSILRDYDSAIQNLRLIKRPGENRWSPQAKRWSEAALGEDTEGRILFVFSRAPFTMHDFNRLLLSAELGLVAAQHLEGGPEAQLYLKAGGEEIELFGSFETGFREDDTNGHAWPVPNVLGVRPIGVR